MGQGVIINVSDVLSGCCFKNVLMKRLILILFCFVPLCSAVMSQAPEGFSYQAVVRNEKGEPLTGRSVAFRFRIVQGTPSGQVAYAERHDVSTDDYGFVALAIGEGDVISGSFGSIDWGAGIWFLNVALDTLGGSAFNDMGTTRFLSVPYSLFAKNGFSGDYNDLINKPTVNGSETRIAAGDNISLSGSGTEDDPYVVGETSHYVGESYGGGIVFYVYDNGRHGLIAAPSDTDHSIEWYNGIRRYTNTTGDGIGSGEMNTTLIIALQTNDNPMSDFAAKACADYSVVADGIMYGDWYLPSRYELALLFFNREVIGNFSEAYYWSSTEFSSLTAWGQDFSNGVQHNLNKSMPYAIRAIRAF